MKVFSREYWDAWLQKFFALPISLKFLCIAGFFTCRIFDLISGTDLVAGVGTIMVIRGVIQVRRVINDLVTKKSKEKTK